MTRTPIQCESEVQEGRQAHLFKTIATLVVWLVCKGLQEKKVYKFKARVNSQLGRKAD